MSAEEVIAQNLKINILTLIGTVLVLRYCVRIFHPIKIIKTQIYIFSLCLLFIPYILSNSPNLLSISCVQFAIFAFVLTPFCSETPYFKHVPISKRFRILGGTFGIATALANAFISLSTMPLVDFFGYYAIWVIFIPIITCCYFSLNYIKKLEIKKGTYNNYPDEDFPNPDTAINEKDFQYELGDEYAPFKGACEYSIKLLNALKIITYRTGRKLNMKLIEKSIIFAKKWHGKAMRKTGDHPFYYHPLAVAEFVAQDYPKTDVIIASILHDVVEDSDCTVKLIETEFNNRIAELVDRLTKKRIVNGKKVVLTFEETINKLRELGDYEALFIKETDRRHNLETIEGLKPEKQQKMAKETNNILIRLISIIGDKLNITGGLHLEEKIYNLSKKKLK